MQKINVALACALAFTLTATAESYTYNPGDESLGDGAVTITYDGDTTDIATLTANPSNGETITLTGGAATFADGATLTLSSSGTVSFAEKVTTKGALTLVRGDDVYRVWTGAALTTDAAVGTLAFENATVADYDCIHVVAGRPSSAHLAVGGRYDAVGGSMGGSNFVVLNRVTAAFTYSVRVQLWDKNGSIYARCRTGVRSPRRGLYPELDDGLERANLWDGSNTASWWGSNSAARGACGIYGADSTGDPKTYGGTWLGFVTAMGLNKIILKRKNAVGGAMKVRFDGGAALGGTTTIPFGIEAVVAVVGGSDASTFSKTITGDGDFTLAPSTDTETTPEREGFVPTSWTTLAANRLLSSMTGIVGYMQGPSHNASSSPTLCTTVAYRYDPVNDEATCQFHLKRSETSSKYVAVKFRQNGLNVEIAGVGSGYTEVGTGGSEAYPAFGTVAFPHQKIKTAEYEVADWASIATLKNESTGYVSGNYSDGSRYGIRKITATFAGGGTATISGNIETLYGGKFTMAGANGAKMLTLVSSTNGLPAGGEAHVGEGVLRIATTGTPGLGTTKIVVHSGGDVRNIGNWQIGANQDLVLDGGRFFGLAEATYLNYVTLSNAVMNNIGPRISNGTATSYWRVIGSEPSTIGQFTSSPGTYDGVLVFGKSTASAARSGNIAFRIEVQDVTGDSDADCVLTRIRDAAGRTTDRSSFAWFFFEKHGPGTLKITGDSKELRLESKLYGGTLLLAGNNIMTNEVQFLGGGIAVEAGKSNNNLGQLTAEKGGTITVGEGGSLAFASFAPDAGLEKKSILIDAPQEGATIKFNTALTDEQLRYFRWKDDEAPTGSWRVAQDSAGLHPLKWGTVIQIR